MEPRGCNRWQPFASRAGARTAKSSENRCRGPRPVDEYSAGGEFTTAKNGVSVNGLLVTNTTGSGAVIPFAVTQLTVDASATPHLWMFGQYTDGELIMKYIGGPA